MLINSINDCISECDAFLLNIGINLEDVVTETDTFKKLEMLRQAYMKIIEKDDIKNRFSVMTNLLINLYDASKPEIFERCWENSKFSPLYYLNGLLCNQIDDEKLNRAKVRMSKTLDQSVYAADTDPNGGYVRHEGEVIDLSKVDLDAVREGRNRTLHGSSWIIRSHRHCFK